MPWGVGDVERHNKGLAANQKKLWVKVANDALRRCIANGRSQKECEGSAIKQANAVVAQKEANIRFFKENDEKQVVYGVIFEPDFVDAHEEYVEKEDIETAAHEYLIKLRRTKGIRTKLSHQMDIDGVCDIVESYIAPATFVINNMTVKEGSWVIAMKIWDENLWRATKDEITGYSPGGTKIIE